MHLYLLRHGQTDYNVRGLCNDDPAVEVHLNEAGIRQAEAAAAELKDVPIDRIVVSELPRTRETAQIVNRGRGLPITVQPLINDIRTGFEGRPSAEHRRYIAADPMHITPPGGESLLEHARRVLGLLDWLARLDDEHVLVVSHEEPIRVLAAHLRGLPLERLREIQVGNAEVFHFEI